MEGGGGQHSLWRHLPLLVQSNSKESIEYILQALWRTRNTGLDSTDRDILRGMLRLETESDLDPLLLCLRMIIRKCVRENLSRDGIQKLFPPEVPLELQKLLSILLQKFLQEWREDVAKEQASLPRLKAMTCAVADKHASGGSQAAVISLKLQSDVQPLTKQEEVKFQLTKDTLETLMKSMYALRDQLTSMNFTQIHRLLVYIFFMRHYSNNVSTQVVYKQNPSPFSELRKKALQWHPQYIVKPAIPSPAAVLKSSRHPVNRPKFIGVHNLQEILKIIKSREFTLDTMYDAFLSNIRCITMKTPTTQF